MRDLFGQHRISWQTVFYHYSKWCKDSSWYKLFIALLNYNRHLLNMSSVALDGFILWLKELVQKLAIREEKVEKQQTWFF